MRKKKSREHVSYQSPKEGEWVQCSRPPFENFDSCCGCGLVHRYEYKLVPVTRGKGLTLWRRIFLDNRRTAQIRRSRLKSKEIYKTSDGWYIAAFPINEREMRKRKKRK
jgi:hypothetical protein